MTVISSLKNISNGRIGVYNGILSKDYIVREAWLVVILLDKCS